MENETETELETWLVMCRLGHKAGGRSWGLLCWGEEVRRAESLSLANFFSCRRANLPPLSLRTLNPKS